MSDPDRLLLSHFALVPSLQVRDEDLLEAAPFEISSSDLLFRRLGFGIQERWVIVARINERALMRVFGDLQ